MLSTPRVTALESNVKGIGDTVTSLTSRHDEIRTQLDSVQKSLTELRNNAAQQKSTVDSSELEKDICDEEVVRFGIKDWDVPVLKAGKKWPSSGRILLFTWVNRDQQLYLELGLGWSPEGTDTREKLFQVALSNDPPFNLPHYQKLPPQWIYLYRRINLKQPEYTNMGNDTLSVYISKQRINFPEKELPLLDSVLKAQQWIWNK